MITWDRKYHQTMNQIKHPDYIETRETKMIQSFGWDKRHEETKTMYSDDYSVSRTTYYYFFRHKDIPDCTLELRIEDDFPGAFPTHIIYKNNILIYTDLYNLITGGRDLNQVIMEKIFERIL